MRFGGTLVVLAAAASVLVYGACSTTRLGPIGGDAGAAEEPEPDPDEELDPDEVPGPGDAGGLVDARADAKEAGVAVPDATTDDWPCPAPPSAGGALDREWAAGPLPPASPPPGTYALKAKTVCDRTTLLEWERVVGAELRTWSEARDYCDSLLLEGASDWRLPTRIELLSIVDFARKDPAIDPVAFPATPAELFWSSTLMFGVFNDPNAYLVAFDRGHSAPFTKQESIYVRCVRGGR